MSGLGQIVGGVIGAVVGFYAGGNVALGYSIGSGLGGYLTAEDIEHPLNEDFSVDSTGYGSVIKIINGTDKVQCVPIWAHFDTQKNSESAKGGAKEISYDYSVDIALLIGEPTDAVIRVWHGPDLIIDNRPASESGSIELESGMLISYTFYNGAVDQEPDPLMESHLGVGNVPAYRHVSMLVIEGLDLTATQGRALPIFVEARRKEGVGGDFEGEVIDHTGNLTQPFIPLSRTDSLYSVISTAIDSTPTCDWWYGAVTAVKSAIIRSDKNVSGSIQIAVVSDRDSCISVSPKVIAASLRNAPLYSGGDPYEVMTETLGYWRLADDGHVTATINGWVATVGTTLIIIRDRFGTRKTVAIPFPIIITDTGANVISDTPSGEIDYPLDGSSNGQSGICRSLVAASDDKTVLYYAFGSVIFKYFVITDSVTGSVSLSKTSINFDVSTLPVPCDRVRFLAVSSVGDVYFLIRSTVDGAAHIYSYDESFVAMKTYTTDATADGTGPIPDYSQCVQVKNNFAIVNNTSTLYSVELSSSTSAVEIRIATERGSANLGLNQYRLSMKNIGMQTYQNLATIFSQSAEPDALSDIIASYCRNLNVTQYDASLLTDEIDGVTLDRSATGKDAIATLQKLFFFSGYVDSTGKIIFRPLSTTPTVTIDADDLGAGINEADDSRVVLTIPNEKARPKEVRLGYRPREAQYENAVQTIRLAASDTQEVIEDSYRIVISDQAAKNIANRMAHDLAVRAQISINVPFAYQEIVPGDVITIPDESRTHVARVTRVRKAQTGIYSIEAEKVSQAPQAPAATAHVIAGQQIAVVAAPDLIVFQGILRDQDDNLGIYVIGGQKGLATSPAAIKTSVGGGAWGEIGTLGGTSITGYAIDVMGDGKPDITDYQRSVTVMLWDDTATLESITYSQLMNGNNAALIGNEVIGFKSATLQPNGAFLLEGIVGGRQGTEQEMGGHAVGDRFALIDEAKMYRLYFPQGAIGASRSFSLSIPRATDTAAATVVQSGVSLKPWEPAHVKAALTTNIAITWSPRYRVNASWINGVDATPDSNEQSWRVDIYDQADDITLLRTAAVTAATYDYADHVADGVNTSNQLRIVITQISTIVGDGYSSDNMVTITS